jgi:hypothetical protein
VGSKVAAASRSTPAGIRFVVTEDGSDGAAGGSGQPPFAGLRLRRDADPYLLWETTDAPRGKSECPLIAVRQARAGAPAE